MRTAPAQKARVRSALTVLVPALLVPPAVLLARVTGSSIVLPALATAVVYPTLASQVMRGRRLAAAAAALLWAASLSASVIACTVRDPRGMESVVLHGAGYRDEMFDFIRTGSGTESDPARFVPQHLLHLVVFCLLSVASGGLLGIGLGAVLVGYMSFYVGCLAGAGGSPATALILGWPPWAILRVVAFVILGIALSEPVLDALRRRLRGRAEPSSGASGAWLFATAVRPWRSWYLAAGILLGADATMKYLLAPTWAGLLRPCLGA